MASENSEQVNIATNQDIMSKTHDNMPTEKTEPSQLHFDSSQPLHDVLSGIKISHPDMYKTILSIAVENEYSYSCTLGKMCAKLFETHLDIVIFFVNNGLDLNTVPNRRILCNNAIVDQNINQLRLLLTRSNVITEPSYTTGSKFCHYLVSSVWTEGIALMLEHFTDLECKSTTNETMLSYAAKYRNIPIMKMLIGKGANANLTDLAKYLFNMQTYSELEVLLNATTEKIFNIENFLNNDLFKSGDLRRIEFLINQISSINVKDLNAVHDNKTLLMCGVIGKSETTVKRLIELGADVNIRNSDNMSALYYAIQAADTNIVSLLLSNGANLDFQDKQGFSVLMNAVQLNHIEIVKMLLESGANPNIQNFTGETALMIACKKSLYNIVNLLLTYPVDVYLRDENNKTVFDCNKFDTELAQLLKSKSVNVCKEILMDDSGNIYEPIYTIKVCGVFLVGESTGLPNNTINVSFPSNANIIYRKYDSEKKCWCDYSTYSHSAGLEIQYSESTNLKYHSIMINGLPERIQFDSIKLPNGKEYQFTYY